MTHLCAGNLTIIGSDNGLSPGRRQAIIWTNAGILLIEPLGTNFSEISIEMQTFSFKKMCLKVSFAKWRPFCLGLNVLNDKGVWPPSSLMTRTRLSYVVNTTSAGELSNPAASAAISRNKLPKSRWEVARNARDRYVSTCRWWWRNNFIMLICYMVTSSLWWSYSIPLQVFQLSVLMS